MVSSTGPGAALPRGSAGTATRSAVTGALEPLVDLERETHRGRDRVGRLGADGEVELGHAVRGAVEAERLAQHAELEGSHALVGENGHIGQHVATRDIPMAENQRTTAFLPLVAGYPLRQTYCHDLLHPPPHHRGRRRRRHGPRDSTRRPRSAAAPGLPPGGPDLPPSRRLVSTTQTAPTSSTWGPFAALRDALRGQALPPVSFSRSAWSASSEASEPPVSSASSVSPEPEE